MQTELQTLVLTGASGFIGKYFIDAIKNSYKIYAIARRSQKESDIPDHPNISWIQCDISNKNLVKETTHYIIEKGGADFIFHMAAYYDFENKWHDEYRNTNIDGTQNMLDMAKSLNVKRFIFISSVAACRFPGEGNYVNEKTPPDSDEPYSYTKRIGEQLVKEYNKYFPCFILRLTAVFSDWCEYAPLYKFLNTWLAGKWDSRFLGGKGNSAISYIYIQDVVRLFIVLLIKHDTLPAFDTFIASPNGSITHRELFKTAARDYFGKETAPLFLPKYIAYAGLIFRTLLRKCRIAYQDSFERLWMLRYLDMRLDTDSTYTQKVLGWKPTPRYFIQRRMLYMLDKMRSHPFEWKIKNEAAFKRVTSRPGYMIYRAMIEEKEKLLEWIIIEIRFSEDKKFIHYKKMDFSDFKYYLNSLYHIILTAVRSGDRSLILKEIDDIAVKRFAEGFEANEICEALKVTDRVITSNLTSRKELQSIRGEIYHYIGMTIELAIDEIEELYESIDKKNLRIKLPDSRFLGDGMGLQKMVNQIDAVYRKNSYEVPSNESKGKKLQK